MKLKNKLVIFLSLFVLLGVGFQKTNDFKDYNPTVIVEDHDFKNNKNKELLKGTTIREEFIAKNNRLGTISVKFNNHNRINNDYLLFKIKEVNSNNWYYSNKYKADQFQNNQYFPFGFPEINNSRGKKYQIEISSLAGTKENSVQIVLKDTPFLSKYSFPKTYLQQNKKEIPTFLFSKIGSYFSHIGLNIFLYIIFLSLLLSYLLRLINIEKLFLSLNKLRQVIAKNNNLFFIKLKTNKSLNKLIKTNLFKNIKNNYLVILTFIFLIFVVALFINRNYLDVPYLDGLMQVPNVEKYFNGTLSTRDITQQWGEHRLIGYTFIFLINTIIFGLNMKLEPYIFLLVDFLIGMILYILFKRFFINNSKKNINIWIQISYIPILFVVFNLVHSPGMLMTTQFAIGTLFFIILSIFFDKLCRNIEKWYQLIGFFLSFFVYITIFSGSYLGGILLSFTGCILFKLIFSKNKRISIYLLFSILFTLFLTISYVSLTKVNLNGINLSEKIFIFFSKSGESFLALLTGISASTIDIHTFTEKLYGVESIVIINGSVLSALGIFSIYQFVKLKMFETTYLPLILMLYSIGSIFTIRLGRLEGGWLWTMNEWYALHLYFYLVGLLWIICFYVFEKFKNFKKKSIKYFFSHNILPLTVVIFAFFWIFCFQIISNIYLWHRAPYVKQYLEVKRQAILFPTDESLKTLLWSNEDSLNAIRILKKYKLSIFRQNNLDKIIKTSEWNNDGWIGKYTRALLVSNNKGILLMSVYVPKEIFSEVYQNSLKLQIIIDGKIIDEKNFVDDSFNKGPVNITLIVPKNKILNLELKLNKSYTPSKLNLGKDIRELGIIINKLNIK